MSTAGALLCAVALGSVAARATSAAVRVPVAEAGPSSTAARVPDAPAWVPHEVIVGYRDPVAVAATRLVMGVRRISAAAAPSSRLLTLPAGESVTAAVARLRRQPGVAWAEPNYIAHTAGYYIPDDRGPAHEFRGWERVQWNFLSAAGVQAPQAWSNLRAVRRPGGKGVIVAVLDTGIAYRNWRQFSESPDFTRTRFVDPFDFIDHNRFPLDRNGHGTFVAGVLAESTNNGFGLTGLAYGVSIMPVRVLDANGEGDEETIARGIRYAVAHHAQVINLSLEFLPSQVASAAEIPELASAIAFAHRHGATVVGAAGNDETDQIAYPAAVPGVIAVGATTWDRCLANYSNGGSGLQLVAPGGGQDAVLPGDPDCHPERSLPSIHQMTLIDPPHWNRFGYPGGYFGTSMAAPEVAGTAALVIASRVIGAHPSPDQLLARLEQTATPLGGAVPNPNYGYGLVNAGAATAPGPVTTPAPAAG